MSENGTENNDANERIQCWVCFATHEDDKTMAWVTPCRCKGSTKWVHQLCLQRWIDEKQHGNSMTQVNCPQCGTEYQIVYPALGPLVYVLDIVDKIVKKSCPFVAGGILIGSVYWTAVTYGAVTIMQVLGHKEGLGLMEKADPLFLLIGLPTIPLSLVLGRMIRWENYVLKFWRNYFTKNRLINYFFSTELDRIPNISHVSNDPGISTRLICGALVTPTIATIVGKCLFGKIQSNIQRTLLGGIAYVAIKGAFRIYYMQHQYIRQAQRRIKNYEEPPANDNLQSSESGEQAQNNSRSE